MNLDSLNNKQLEAVKASGNVLVVAGAGTGKTRVLTLRITELIKQGIKQQNIFAFTFTNKAAKEMKSRTAQLLNNVPKCTISTFHSYFFQELNYLANKVGFEYPIAIIDYDDELKMVRRIIENNHLIIKDTAAMKFISNIKNGIKNIYNSIEEGLYVSIIFKQLQYQLNHMNRMDFDDILYYYKILLLNEKEYLSEQQEIFKYVLIDESQDMNQIQYDIISLLSEKAESIFLVGDQDQCIYTFRGSNLELINRFIIEFNAKVIVLEENYRSSKNILDSANSVIKNNFNRLDKNLFTSNEDLNFKIFYRGFHTSSEESLYVVNLILKLKEKGYKNSDIAVLYRNNMISNGIEKEFIKKGLEFKIYGSYPFFQHKEIKYLINFYRFVSNPKDDTSLQMILNYPEKKLTSEEEDELYRYKERKGITFLQAMEASESDKIKNLAYEHRQLINSFHQELPKDFFQHILRYSTFYDFLIKEKNAKNKMARVVEFGSYIDEIEGEDIIQATQDFINNIYLQNMKEKSQDSVALMTIHQAKGLEFKNVILVGCNQGILPSNKATDTNDEEERRLFYVAITRSRERLFLTSCQRRFINGKNNFYAPSTFLLEMGINF